MTLHSRRTERRIRVPIHRIGTAVAIAALLLLPTSAVIGQEAPVSQPLLDLPLTAADGQFAGGQFADDQFVGQTLPGPAHWWDAKAGKSFMDQPTWVAFGLDTVLLDTLDHSPRIKIVASQASVAIERIVQQDAAFDAKVLFDTRANRDNTPVGNTLTTGGPPRLITEDLTASGGVQRTTRNGGLIDVSQDFGLANSNSTFFSPEQQGNSRLSLSLNQPLLSRSGQFYNERLLAQARIDSRVSWQDMRGEVEGRIAEVAAAYWRLYELRCHYLQTVELLNRGRQIEAFLNARVGFDAGEIELAKIRGRIARRIDREVRLRAEIKKQQAALAALVGSEELTMAMSTMEMIPSDLPNLPIMAWELRDAVQTGIENRPEIRTATAQLEAAALSIRVTRAELEPKLSAVFETYLAGLEGNFRVLDSLTNQFTTGGPGLAAGLQYDLPYGRRAAKSRHREAKHRYQLRSEELREVVLQSQAEIEIALVAVNAAIESQDTKRRLLETAVAEEEILTGRWEALAGDGASVGVVLETLLDAQSRRTDSERELVTTQVEYVVAVVQLQQAMGTLLQQSGATPVQDRSDNSIQFVGEDDRFGRDQRVDSVNDILLMDPTELPVPPSPQPVVPQATNQQWLQQSLDQTLENSLSTFDNPAENETVLQGPQTPQPGNKVVFVERLNMQQTAQPTMQQTVQPTMQPTVENPAQVTTQPVGLPAQPVELQGPAEPSRFVEARRDDVSQLIDTDWLEDTMYGDTGYGDAAYRDQRVNSAMDRQSRQETGQ